MLQKKHLKVIANPFAVPLDQHGRPCAAVLYDPSHSGGFARHIGAKIERVVIEKRGLSYSPSSKQNVGGGGQLDKVDQSFSYDLSPIEIVDTAYHRAAIANGSLVAADEFTAKAGNVKFAQPAHVLTNAQAQCIAEWERDIGEKPPVATWKLANAPKAGEK